MPIVPGRSPIPDYLPEVNRRMIALLGVQPHVRIIFPTMPEEYEVVDAHGLSAKLGDRVMVSTMDLGGPSAFSKIAEFSLFHSEGAPKSSAAIEQSVDKILALARDLLDATQALDRASLYHLDIKPVNMVIFPDGRYRLVDFPSIRLRETTSAPRTVAYSGLRELSSHPVTLAYPLNRIALCLLHLATGQYPYPEIFRQAREASEILAMLGAPLGRDAIRRHVGANSKICPQVELRVRQRYAF